MATEKLKIAVIPSDDVFLNNEIFRLDSKYNRDNCNYPYLKLKQLFEADGHAFNTIDLYQELESVDYFFFFSLQFPWYQKILDKHLENRSIYFAFEPPAVDAHHSENGLHALLNYFKYIFTWNDSAVDGKRIFKFVIPYIFETPDQEAPQRDIKNLLVNLSGNKSSAHPLELYSERKKVIEYFSNYSEIDLYGPGWEQKNFPCYKGMAQSKREVYQHYKFALSLENMRDINGYVTEKMLDCLSAGIIPIYWGANNIEEYVPQNCFIPYWEFKSLQELREYLISMPEAEIQRYHDNISAFVHSELTKVFSVESFYQQISTVLSLDRSNSFVFSCSFGTRLAWERKRFLRRASFLLRMMKKKISNI